MDATVGTRRIIWQGGEHDFCLAAAGSILSLEQNCDAGLAAIYDRLTAGRWYLNDVREPIRLGLIGGGMKAEDAARLVKVNVEQHPHGLLPSVVLARAVIEAVLEGVPDDPVGKKPAAETEAAPTSSMMTADSVAQPSSASVVV